jgi:hypothetical protein
MRPKAGIWRLDMASHRRWIRSKTAITDSPIAVNKSADRIAALGALYQADRQEAAGILLAALALFAAALTYLGVVAIIINNVKLPGGYWTVVSLAFPLWVVAAFHVLLNANAAVRARSIDIIEKRLVDAAGFDESNRQDLGSRATLRVTSIQEQPFRLQVQSVISYGGTLVIIIAFTSYCLAVVAKVHGWTSAPVITGGAVYALLFGMVMLAWYEVGRITASITKE